MSQTIRILESQFNKSHAEMVSAIESLGMLFNEFSATNEDLSGAWEGMGGSSFTSVSQDMEADFALLQRGLEQLSADVQATRDAFAKMDDFLSKAMGGKLPFLGSRPASEPDERR